MSKHESKNNEQLDPWDCEDEIPPLDTDVISQLIQFRVLTRKELLEYFTSLVNNKSFTSYLMECFIVNCEGEDMMIAYVLKFQTILKNILSELPNVTEDAIFIYNRGLSFQLSKKQKIKYHLNEIEKVELQYRKDPHCYLFNIDTFHMDIFSIDGLFRVNKILEEEGGLEYGKQAILDTIYILLRAKILKIEYGNLKNPKVLSNEESPITEDSHSTENILQGIWQKNSNLSVRDFLEKGIDGGIWNEDYKLITKRGSLYGTGKTLLGNLSHALQGSVISTETDYKIIGEVFCKAFNIKVHEKTNEPYKSFNSRNPKIIIQLKRLFEIK